MKQEDEFEIGDIRYVAAQYSLDKALRIFKKLGKIIGKPIGLMAAQGKARPSKDGSVKVEVEGEKTQDELLDQEVDGNLFGAAIQAFFDNIEPENMTALFADILGGTLILTPNGQNRAVNLEIDFRGKIPELFMLIKKVLEFQYGNLFDLVARFSAGTARAGTPVEVEMQAENPNRIRAQ